MEFSFRRFKIFTLDAILHHAVGPVRAKIGKSPGYCFMIGRGPDSCLLRHVSGLLVCLYVKLVVPYIFIFLDFWNNKSCIVLDFELAGKNSIKELEFLLMAKIRILTSSSKKVQSHKQAFWCTRNMHGNLWNSGRLDYSELANFFSRAVSSEYFAKTNRKCKIFGNLLDKMVENLEVKAVPKFKISQMKNVGLVRVSHSDTRPHITVQSASQNRLLTG